MKVTNEFDTIRVVMKTTTSLMRGKNGPADGRIGLRD
jgi:hypothetical protein